MQYIECLEITGANTLSPIEEIIATLCTFPSWFFHTHFLNFVGVLLDL